MRRLPVAQKDMDDAPRLIRFERRELVVAVFAEPQSDEPPGRAPWRETETVLAADAAVIQAADLAAVIAEVQA